MLRKFLLESFKTAKSLKQHIFLKCELLIKCDMTIDMQYSEGTCDFYVRKRVDKIFQW